MHALLGMLRYIKKAYTTLLGQAVMIQCIHY